MATDLTQEARDGYDDPEGRNPHLFSSDRWMAHQAGRALAARARPARAWKARGHAVNVEGSGGNLFRVAFSGKDLGTASVERKP